MYATNVDRQSAVGHPTGREDTGDPQLVLTALEDEACRAILGAAAEETLTALELAEACDVPTSTTYRKVETLTEAGLLEERVRLNVGGKHATEYRACFDEVTIATDDAGGLTLELSRTSPRPPMEQPGEFQSSVADD